MSSIARYAIILVLSCSYGGLVAAIYGQTNSQTTKPSSVSGRVTINGKGAPGIVVGIRNSDFSLQSAPARKAATDQDGNYRINDLPPGNYQVWPLAPAYVNPDLVSRSKSKTLLLSAGEDVQGIDFSLVRGGVISGKVTESDGRPLIEERLTLVPQDKAEVRGQILPVVPGVLQTDDRGIYRIYGIPAGRYKISIGDDPSGSTRLGRALYKRTFHPATTDLNEAAIVEVNEGAEATNIDIVVERSLPGFVASGKVVDGETGQPVMGLNFGLRRMVNDREGDFMGTPATSNRLGEFRLENIPPGKYVVFIAARPGNEVRAEAVPFEVIDQDVTGLLVQTLKGLTLTGNVILEGVNDKSVFARVTELRLQAYVQGETPNSNSWQESVVNPDGSFRVGGLGPGTVNFAFSTQDRRPPTGFAILRVERDGVLQRGGVQVKAGLQTTGVKIVVTFGTGSIRGEVKLENGPLPPDGRLLVLLISMADMTGRTGRYGVDARGHFLIEGVTAGSYELRVTANIPGRRPPSAKYPIEISDGTSKEIVVTLDLKADPDQPRNP